MAFVESIRKSFSRKRRREMRQSAAAEASPESDDESAAKQRSRGGGGITCIVTLLDESEARFEMEKTAMLRDLLNDVSSLLSLQESDYFGFLYTDPDGLECWLHDYKSIAKQMPGRAPYNFTFCVKFYVSDPGQLREDVTRYQFCVQLRNDLFKGKVTCPPEELAEVAAFSLQSELGDYDESMNARGYERQYEFVPNQEGLDIYDKVVELHKDLDGLLPFEAELRLLSVMQKLKGYGVRKLACTGDRGQSLGVHMSHRGIEVTDAESTLQSVAWPSVTKVAHRRKRVTCQIVVEEGQSTTLSFHFSSKRAAKEAWKSMLEQHDFFSIELPQPKPKFISSVLRGSTFRYSGRTQYQIKRMEDFQIRPNLNIDRIGSVRRSTRRPPQRSASSATTRKTDVAITVARSHSLSGASKISSNGVRIPIDDMMRSRNDHSLDSSMPDLQDANEDKASMLVHLGTPAPSTANLPQRDRSPVPGGEDDLDPDYQELNSATLRSQQPISALAAESPPLSRASPPASSQGSLRTTPPLPNRAEAAAAEGASPSPRRTPTDPTTGEPMYNEISNDLPPPPPPEVASVPDPFTNAYEEPTFAKDKLEPAASQRDVSASPNVDIIITVASPTVEAENPVEDTPTELAAVSGASSQSSVKESGEEKKADHVYSMPKPRTKSDSIASPPPEPRAEDDLPPPPPQEGEGSPSGLLSPDVMELMAELGIMEGAEDEDDDGEEHPDSGAESEDAEAVEGAEPDAFEEDPFAQAGAKQFAVGEGCISPVETSALTEQ